ncbi:MAG TPA: hypothetical protein VFO38_01245 [Candidatus Saccharimonadales bacterium]|nr:hypothetical protein [Candidatus Saccharimonadales bacterium]
MDYADLAELGDIRRTLLRNVQLAQQEFAAHIASMYPHLSAQLQEYVEWQNAYLQNLTTLFLVLAEHPDMPIKDVLFHYHSHLSNKASTAPPRPLTLNLNGVGKKTYDRLVYAAAVQILSGEPVNPASVTRVCGITRGGLIRYFSSPLMLADTAYQHILAEINAE